MIAVEAKHEYEAITSGSQTFVIERPGGGTYAICVGPNHAEKAERIARLLEDDERTGGTSNWGD